jgi:hypothetical protein
MARKARTGRYRGGLVAATAVLAALVPTAGALAAGSIVKHQVGSISVAPGQTRTLTVPYPDALEYGNARYYGHATIKRGPARGSARPASIRAVKILATGSVEGGSEFQVRVRNANPAGTGAVELVVTATTVEPLPHS